MTYDFVLIDNIFCESFIKWTYEENSETAGRKGLFDLHLKSAIKKSNDEECILMMTSITRENLEKKYSGDNRNMCFLSSIIEASGEIIIPLRMAEEEALMKSASWLKWKKFEFCILTGNSLIFDSAKKEGFDVFNLSQAAEVLELMKD